jgi:hypothetical protein
MLNDEVAMTSTRGKFRFPLANLLWMMLPLAVVFAVVHHTIWHKDNVSIIVAVAMGIPAAIGALFNGWRGMWRGALVGLVGLIGWLLVLVLFGLAMSIAFH